jgi:hypothetical protein
LNGGSADVVARGGAKEFVNEQLARGGFGAFDEGAKLEKVFEKRTVAVKGAGTVGANPKAGFFRNALRHCPFARPNVTAFGTEKGGAEKFGVAEPLKGAVENSFRTAYFDVFDPVDFSGHALSSFPVGAAASMAW